MTGAGRPSAVPVEDSSQSGGTWSPELAAYSVAAAAALIAFSTPVAVVTSFEGEPIPATGVQTWPQWLVAIGLALAAAGGRLRRAWPVVFMLALPFVVLGGLFGAFGGDLLIDMHDSDASGEIRSGAAVVPLAAALATAAVFIDCRGLLQRINPGRRGAGAWSAAILVAPQATMIVVNAAAFGTLGAPVAGLVLPAPIIGGVVGSMLVRRWADRPAEL